MSLLPESGKPIDLDRDKITTAAEAAAVLNWLDASITDMNYQILQHLTNTQLDLDWLARVRSALRATVKTRFAVAEMKARFDRVENITPERARLFIQFASELLGEDDTDAVWERVENNLPTAIQAA